MIGLDTEKRPSRREMLPLERILEYVDKERGHWLWVGSVNHPQRVLPTPIISIKRSGKGYRAESVRRVVWEIATNHKPPRDKEVIAVCGKPMCVRFEHLRLMTHQEAMQYRSSLRETCIHGHPLKGDNLMLDRQGRKRCRKCYYDKSRRLLQKRNWLVRWALEHGGHEAWEKRRDS